jgi:ubiquitin-activating enzyme E1 C
VCSQIPSVLPASATLKLEQIISFLCDEKEFRMKNPALTACIQGKQKTLYMGTIASIEKSTRPNLKKTLTGKFL